MAHFFLKYFPEGSFTKHVFINFPRKPRLSQQPFLKVPKNKDLFINVGLCVSALDSKKR